MEQNRMSAVLSCHNELFDEFHHTNALIYATLSSCQEREFKGEYYGIPPQFISMISNERNEYISLLTIATDKLKYINKLNLNMEREITSLY